MSFFVEGFGRMPRRCAASFRNKESVAASVFLGITLRGKKFALGQVLILIGYLLSMPLLYNNKKFCVMSGCLPVKTCCCFESHHLRLILVVCCCFQM